MAKRFKPKRTTAEKCYRFSLFIFILFTGLILLGALYDIEQQIIKSPRGGTKPTDIIITAGSYLLVAILSGAIALSRYLTVRRALVSIPKPFMPIEIDDVPKNVHELISTEYSRCALIAHISQPKGRKLQGWGVPGTQFENVHFRSAILDTFSVLAQVLEPFHSLSLPNPSVPLSTSKSSSPLDAYLPLLFGTEPPLLLPQYLPLLKLYSEHLQRANFAHSEPTQADYEDCLRVVAVIMAELQKLTELQKLDRIDKEVVPFTDQDSYPSSLVKP